MKRFRWYVWLAVTGLAFTLLDVMAFGAVVGFGTAGAAAAEQARNEQPATHTYMVLGTHFLQLVPILREPANAIAHRAWDSALPSMRSGPHMAADRLFDSGSGLIYGLVRFSFWAGPLLLLAAALGWWRKPRPVHLIKHKS